MAARWVGDSMETKRKVYYICLTSFVSIIINKTKNQGGGGWAKVIVFFSELHGSFGVAFCDKLPLLGGCRGHRGPVVVGLVLGVAEGGHRAQTLVQTRLLLQHSLNVWI